MDHPLTRDLLVPILGEYSPSRDDVLGSTADCLSSPPASGPAVAVPTLFLADKPHFRTQKLFVLDPVEKPLKHSTFRYGNVVQLPSTPETRTGKGYTNHVPLTVQLRVNSSTALPLSSLHDTGASLSGIDASLLERLGGRPQEEGMLVKGIGEMRTKGFATVTFFIEGRDSRDKQVFLECTHDLHVLPSFGPGLLLGRDFIDGHDLTISPARGRAVVGQYTFAVTEKVGGPFATDVELRTAADVVVPSNHNMWVPVDTGSLAPNVDYCVHPRLSASSDETVQLAGPTGLITRGEGARRHVLLGNFGVADCHLQRGTIVADAQATRVGDTLRASGRDFSLPPAATPASSPHAWVASTEIDPLSGVADPLDAFEPDDGPSPDPRHDSATVLIDDRFRVGVDAKGRSPSEIVALLRRHEPAFALDGRPGLVRGTEMAIDLKEGTILRPEAPRRVSPEKREAIDTAIDQLLAWDVVEPSSSPASFPVLMVRQYGKMRFCVDYRQLNASTIPDRYPLPTVDSVFQTLCGKRIFSSLDAIRGYHQLPSFETEAPPLQSAESAQLLALDLVRLPSPIARERWTSWLRADRHFAAILREAERVVDPEAAVGDWVLNDGVLVRRSDGRIALPEGAVPELLRSVHDNNGHFGFYKTYLAVARSFWRPGLSVAVRSWVKYCRSCQKTKVGRKTGVLDIAKDPQLPFETISLDLVYGFPSSRSGNNAALVILDVFSRMVLIEPCANTITAEGVAAIVSNRVLRYGWLPRRIVSDSEARLTGSVMTALSRSLGASLTPSPPYHQQANAVERAIQTVQTVLQSVSLESHAHWDRRLAPAVELAMNSTPSLSTGQRPFDLVFVSHPDVVHAVFDGEEEHEGVGGFDERLAAAEERLVEARRCILLAREDQKRRYDQSRAPSVSLRVGDQVHLRLKDQPVPGAITSKLDARKDGPFDVVEIVSPHRVRLALPDHIAADGAARLEEGTARLEEIPPLLDDDGADGDARLDPDVALPPRPRRLPTSFRGFHLGVLSTADRSQLEEALREPMRKARRVALSDRTVVLTEKPVAFLSRLTTPAEKKMVAAELELRCLAWAYAKWAYLLEGALVTVVTDHQPMGAMLSSTSGVSYGPNISRRRALIMPHLPNLRFVVRPGHAHVNADALSRLPTDPSRSAFFGGDVLGGTSS
ncbi:hypothetical protein A4X06_0g7445 [Tilletia controversa]|uniref:Reverse transcriptase n=1 Tax=Tilletia controversa TaxID=13291 RepID=A0A8X7MMT2_9BASI|nr:hypothetical protein A4X06_0g7445 [Tilletia controversa]